MSKYYYRIFTIIDLHFGAMQPCSSGLGMKLEASDFRSFRRLVAYLYIHTNGKKWQSKKITCNTKREREREKKGAHTTYIEIILHSDTAL